MLGGTPRRLPEEYAIYKRTIHTQVDTQISRSDEILNELREKLQKLIDLALFSSHRIVRIGISRQCERGGGVQLL